MTPYILALAAFAVLVIGYSAWLQWRHWCETTENDGEF